LEHTFLVKLKVCELQVWTGQYSEYGIR